jgi:hypothetical protein
VTALIAGTLIALVALAFVLYPLLVTGGSSSHAGNPPPLPGNEASSSGEVVCDRCGARVAADARYCAYCGASLGISS